MHMSPHSEKNVLKREPRSIQFKKLLKYIGSVFISISRSLKPDRRDGTTNRGRKRDISSWY